VLFGLVLFLTIKPNPAIQEVRWMPRESSAFFDLHDGWKNAVGFGMLALAGFIGWPQGYGVRVWTRRFRRIVQAATYCAVVVLMELLQLFIPTRFCDVDDMASGSLGVLVARLAVSILDRFNGNTADERDSGVK
jgi:hypothetical protein